MAKIEVLITYIFPKNLILCTYDIVESAIKQKQKSHYYLIMPSTETAIMMMTLTVSSVKKVSSTLVVLCTGVELIGVTPFSFIMIL